MKRLILMRHAKSDWSDLDATDHERSLNTRGQHAAQIMGNCLRTHQLTPDHVLCSDAKRTIETLELLALGDLETTFTRKLYLAEPDVLAATLRRRSEDCVMIVAHNPGCAMLADMLLQRAPDHPEFYRYPTGAILVADFDIDAWSALRAGTGTLAHFTVPRDLHD